MDARNYANPIVFEAIEGIKASDIDYSYNRYITDKNGDHHATFVSAITPEVHFLHVRSYGPKGRPNSYLSDDLTKLLPDYEVTYYDIFGNSLPVTEKQTLSQLYDYNLLENEDKGTFSFVHNGHSYLCYYLYNADNHTKFVLYTRDVIDESQRMAILFLCIGAFCVLVICFTFALLFVKRTYNPLDALISRLPHNNSGVIRDDYRILADALDSMDTKIKTQNLTISRNCILRLLKGQSIEGYEDCLPDMLINDNGSTLAVAAIRIDTAEKGEFPEESDFEGKVMDEFYRVGYDALQPTWEDDLLYLVFRLDEKDCNDLTSEFLKLQAKVKYSISVYISKPHQSVRQLRRSYSEVKAVAEYCTLLERYGTIQRYDEIQDILHEKKSTVPNLLQLQRLSDYTVALSLKNTLNQYDLILYQFSERAGRSLEKEDIEFSVLVDTIALAFYDIALPGDIRKEIIHGYVEQIKEAQNSKQLRELLKTCLDKFCKLGDNRNSDSRFEQIKAFIKENFQDPNLSSASVADRFGTSPSNITRMFKKYNQTGFLEYVHHLRVTKATQLLKETDLPVAEIATRVGYTNVITMSRVFKSYAHSTPGMVRKLHSSDNE